MVWAPLSLCEPRGAPGKAPVAALTPAVEEEPWP
jgi:hypothetical protein